MDKLLIIDDSEFVGSAISTIFKDELTVHYTNTPKKGIDLAIELNPDLILLDVVMPNINGFELNNIIKSHSSLARIPVIFITSSTNDKIIESCFSKGAVDYIKKPFNNIELKHRVLMHINNYKVSKQLSEAMDRLHKIAHTDHLTTLYNRRYFIGMLDKEIGDHNMVLVLSDIDDFKKINDTYGHDGGDYVLKKVSHILKTKIKQPNVIARWGGEEFIAFIKDTDDHPNALSFMEDIRKTMADEYYIFNGVEFTVTVSFGLCKLGNLDVTEAMRFADKALYKSKMSGKNMCCVWDSNLDD